MNYNNFSPSQIIFGKNTNLPNTLTNNLPALKIGSQLSEIAVHIGSLHSTREVFMKAE